jgi:hypothetical protein
LKINKSHYLNFIHFLAVFAYSLFILHATIEFFNKENISSKDILFNGEIIEWLKSSVTFAGRFVPFSNTFNLLLFNFTDNIKYFIFLKIFLILFNFLILKKIFDYLNIRKYFTFAIIIICYNHAFLNGQYITSSEGDISLLITILFYLDLKRSDREIKKYEYFLTIFLMIFLLGIKESMLGFFIVYTFLKIFFYKNDNLLIKFTYLIILILYIYFYYNFTLINIDKDNIYGVKNDEVSILFNISKILLNYIVTFPFTFFVIIFILKNFIKNLSFKKKTFSIGEIYFISILGYFAIYISLNLFAFRYVLVLLFILIPLFFAIYTTATKKKTIITLGVLIFIFGPGYSNTIELFNNFISKEYNTKLNIKLQSLQTEKNVAIIYNQKDKQYLLKKQKHDQNDLGNLLTHFEDKKYVKINLFYINDQNINTEFLSNKLIISLIKNDLQLQEKIENLVDTQTYNKFLFRRNCMEPSLIKTFFKKKNCNEITTTLYLRK